MEFSPQTKAADALAADALKMLDRFGFDASKPSRMIAGIALSSREPNVNGDSFIAAGVNFSQPTVLLFDHDFSRPMGKVLKIEVREDRLLFRAEIANSLAWVDQIWKEIVDRNLEMASVYVTAGPVVDRTFAHWQLHEISVLQLGADFAATINRCWERSPVVYSDGRPSETVYWSKHEHA